MRRVLVLGSGGAGKTTFSLALGAATGLPVVHLDEHFWHPGWVKTPTERWRETVVGLAARETWIMDGNYGGTLDLRLEAADTVVLLDTSRWTCLWRVVRRRRPALLAALDSLRRERAVHVLRDERARRRFISEHASGRCP